MIKYNFISKAKELQKLKTKYKLGTFMNKKDEFSYLCDCSGLIKAIFWGYPSKGSYQTNGLKDINANTMIKHCTKSSTNFSKIQDGAIVWLSGHIGIYIGNGIVIECTPKWKGGVQKSFCKGSPFKNEDKLNERKWTKWGLFKYVDYSSTINDKTITYYTKVSSKYTSLVDALKSIKVDASFDNRKKIAKANGISNYTGTSKQNIQLLEKLKLGKLVKT